MIFLKSLILLFIILFLLAIVEGKKKKNTNYGPVSSYKSQHTLATCGRLFQRTSCCIENAQDTLFLIDSSLTMTREFFYTTVLDFTQEVFCGLINTSTSKARAGLLTFGLNSTEIIPFGNYTSREWYAAVEKVRRTETSCCAGNRPLAETFDLAQQVLLRTSPLSQIKPLIFVIATNQNPLQNPQKRQQGVVRLNVAQYMYDRVPKAALSLKNLSNHPQILVLQVNAQAKCKKRRNRIRKPCVVNQTRLATRVQYYYNGIADPLRTPKNKINVQCIKSGRKRYCNPFLSPPFPIVKYPTDARVLPDDSKLSEMFPANCFYADLCPPTASPTSSPVIVPTFAKTPMPTPLTKLPTLFPTLKPTPITKSPTTIAPSEFPTIKPTIPPTTRPPTLVPTSRSPSESPTLKPTKLPTSRSPTKSSPTFNPTTSSPTLPPTNQPSRPSKIPTRLPTTVPPTNRPVFPTISPTHRPTNAPTLSPTRRPSSLSPTTKPKHLDMYLYLDNGCVNGDRTCWNEIISYALKLVNKSVEIYGWSGSKKLTPVGLRIWMYGYVCQSFPGYQQNEPNMEQFMNGVASQEEFNQKLTLAYSYKKEKDSISSSSCPQAAVDDSFDYISSNVELAPLRSERIAILFLSGKIQDRTDTTLNSAIGLGEIGIRKYAFYNSFGLTTTVRTQQLEDSLTFCDQQSTHVFPMFSTNSTSFFEVVTEDFTTNIPILPLKSQKWYWCGFDNDYHCELRTPFNYRLHCDWIPNNPANPHGRGRCVDLEATSSPAVISS